MTLTPADIVAVLAADGLAAWLFKILIEKRFDLLFQSRLEKLKADLDVRSAFSKIVAEKRMEALLDVWSATRRFSGNAWANPAGNEALDAYFRHLDAAGAVYVLLPKATIEALNRYRERMFQLVAKSKGGSVDLATIEGAREADVELLDHLRDALEAEPLAKRP
jgi:hypothetical protein